MLTAKCEENQTRSPEISKDSCQFSICSFKFAKNIGQTSCEYTHCVGYCATTGL